MFGYTEISNDGGTVKVGALYNDDFKSYTMPSLTFEAFDDNDLIIWDNDEYLLELHQYLTKRVNKEKVIYDNETEDLLKLYKMEVQELYNMFNKADELGFFNRVKNKK